MASFTKLPSGKWRASIKANGLRKTKAFNTKPEAQQWAYETEQELKGGAAVVEGARWLMPCRGMLTKCRPRKKARAGEYVRAAALAKEDIGSQLLTTITRPVINEWIVARGKSVMASTVNRELNFLSAVFERRCVASKGLTGQTACSGGCRAMEKDKWVEYKRISGCPPRPPMVFTR